MNVIEHETQEQAREAAGKADRQAAERHVAIVGKVRLVFLPGRPSHPIIAPVRRRRPKRRVGGER